MSPPLPLTVHAPLENDCDPGTPGEPISIHDQGDGHDGAAGTEVAVLVFIGVEVAVGVAMLVLPGVKVGVFVGVACRGVGLAVVSAAAPPYQDRIVS